MPLLRHATTGCIISPELNAKVLCCFHGLWSYLFQVENVIPKDRGNGETEGDSESTTMGLVGLRPLRSVFQPGWEIPNQMVRWCSPFVWNDQFFVWDLLFSKGNQHMGRRVAKSCKMRSLIFASFCLGVQFRTYGAVNCRVFQGSQSDIESLKERFDNPKERSLE